MRRYAVPFSLTILGAALALPYAAIADTPLAPYEGRPLPPFVKALIWEKACDIPQAEAEGDFCQGDLCRFARTTGTPFKPQVAGWMQLTMFEAATGQNALAPALIEANLAGEDDIRGDVRLAVAIASGLTVDGDPEDFLVQLNPLLTRWVMRELLPPPDEAMCGQTARELYQAAFAQPTRVMVDVYAKLKARGTLRRVDREALEKSYDTQKGRYATTCEILSKKSDRPDEQLSRAAACWWWLRRAATGGTLELAQLFGRALHDYDPEVYKKYKRALPKL